MITLRLLRMNSSQSQDMFSSPQVIPAALNVSRTSSTARATTPSQSPTRSVKRQQKNRLTGSGTQLSSEAQPKREDLPFLRKRCSYDLRSLTLPNPRTTDEFKLWEPYGIRVFPKSSKAEKEQSSVVSSAASSMHKTRVQLVEAGTGDKLPTKCRMISLLLLLSIMALSSALMGAFLYAYINHHYYKEDSQTPHSYLQPYNTEVCRTSDVDPEINDLKSSVKHLADEINSLKHKESKSDLIIRPSRNVWEELFGDEADIAAAGNLGSVLATPDTHTYKVPLHLTAGILSFSVDVAHRPPDTVLKGLINEVGDCWAFTGHQGRLVLSLHRPSLLTAVSLSHITASVTVTGNIDTAPRHFLLLGHLSEKNLDNGILLGEFEYKRSGPWRQTFNLASEIAQEQVFKTVEFQFMTNYGHPNYTCVYRVHVHGNMVFN